MKKVNIITRVSAPSPVAKSPWYKRSSVLISILLTVLTVGVLLPVCVAVIKRHKHLKIIAFANCVSFVILFVPSISLISLFGWFGLMLVAIFSKRTQNVETDVETDKESPVASTDLSMPSIPVWEPPKMVANPAVDPQEIDSIVAEKQPESQRFEIEPGFIWSKKALKSRKNIEKRLSIILVGDEKIYGVSSTTRIKGATIDFVCATDARLIVFNSKGPFRSNYEWALWSDLRPVERKTSGIFPNSIRCELKNGTEVPMGQLLESAACDDFFKIINQFVATPPNLSLEAEVRSVESARFEQAREFTSISTTVPEARSQEKQKLTFKQYSAFKRLYKKQISGTELAFKKTYQTYIGLYRAFDGFKNVINSIDLDLLNSSSEQNILSIAGCNLIEVRKGARVTHRESSYSGSSSGGSVRVGRFRVGGGRNRGSSSSSSISYPAPDELARVDRGKFLVTNLRVSFVGSMFTKSAEYKKIADYRSQSGQILIAPRSGSKVWIVEFPSEAKAWTAEFLLGTALATPQKRLDEKSGSIGRDIKNEFMGNFEETVAGIESDIRKLEDELHAFRDAWREYLRQYPGRLNALASEMSAEKPEFSNQSGTNDQVTLSLLSIPERAPKIVIIKVIREATNLSLSEAKHVVDSVPSTLGKNFEVKVLEDLQSQLRTFGVESEII